jgi:hypothetical protein
MVTGTRGRSAGVLLVGVGVVVALALGAGLLLTGGTPLPSADEAAQQYSELDAYNATYTVTFDEPGRHVPSGSGTR